MISKWLVTYLYGYEEFESERVTVSWGMEAKFEPSVEDAKEEFDKYLLQRFQPDKG